MKKVVFRGALGPSRAHLHSKGLVFKICFITGKAKNETVRLINLPRHEDLALFLALFRLSVNGTNIQMQRNRSVLRTEPIIDLPPQERSLRFGDRAILLAKQIEVENGTRSEDFQCGTSENQTYLHGTVVKHQNTRRQLNAAIRGK